MLLGEKGGASGFAVASLIVVCFVGSALVWDAGRDGFVAVVEGIVVEVVCGAVVVVEGTVEGVASNELLAIDIATGAGSVVAIVGGAGICRVMW